MRAVDPRGGAPVFVDVSGRRKRRVSVLGYLGASACAAYVAAFGVTLTTTAGALGEAVGVALVPDAPVLDDDDADPGDDGAVSEPVVAPVRVGPATRVDDRAAGVVAAPRLLSQDRPTVTIRHRTSAAERPSPVARPRPRPRPQPRVVTAAAPARAGARAATASTTGTTPRPAPAPGAGPSGGGPPVTPRDTPASGGSSSGGSGTTGSPDGTGTNTGTGTGTNTGTGSGTGHRHRHGNRGHRHPRPGDVRRAHHRSLLLDRAGMTVARHRSATRHPHRAAPAGPGLRRLAPRPGVLLVVVALLMFSCLLLVHGLARSQVGVDATGAAPTSAAMDEVPSTVTDGGPILDTRGPVPASARMPARTIGLTFDDGPDPTWTPQVLEVLRRHHVPATFFVVGSMGARHPELLREIRAAGSEVGLHTFTHPDLGEASGMRIDRELTETQLVLAGALGESSYLLRPPYSSTASAVDNDALRSYRATGADGYVTVLSDVDSRDWERPGVDAIVRNSVPAGGAGGVVLLHDAGGDRSQTVAALDRLIPQLQAQGYRFTTPATAVGLPPDNRPVSTTTHLLGSTLIGLVAVAGVVVDALTWLLLVVGVLVVLRLVLMLVVARRHHRARHRPGWSWGPPVTAPVSVIVPAYNEKENIAATVRSLVASDHPVEVLVVDDGSTDGTADIVEALALPGVRVLRQVNGGKPAALNTGIAHARHELIVMIDGDTVFEPATVGALVAPFADPAVGAVAGNAKVASRRGLISRWQHIEYVMGFNVDRRVYDVLRCMPTIPGAVGAFRRRVLLEVGGVSDDTLAEDTDLTMAVCRTGWRVVYEESARAWTEAPATLGQLWRQRYRWSYGTMQSMWKHRAAVGDRGASGRFGRAGLAHLAVFQVLLPLLAPLVDIFLVYGLLFLDPVTTLVAWSAVLAVQVLAAVVAFRLEREPLRVLWLLPLQQIVYRQLMYAVLIRSLVTAVGGIRLGWQKLRRVGGLDALVVPRDPALVLSRTP